MTGSSVLHSTCPDVTANTDTVAEERDGPSRILFDASKEQLMPRFAGRRRASSLGALCVALAVPFATAARAQQQSDPVFKVTTEVVVSTVLVFDPDGRPVDGLER